MSNCPIPPGVATLKFQNFNECSGDIIATADIVKKDFTYKWEYKDST